MKEVSAEDCKKDAACVTVKLNVVYDKNANDGKGLTDAQKKLFQDRELQSAKDQYGNADVHFDVSFTAGGYDDKGNFTGAAKDAINVFVTDAGNKGDSGITENGYALTKININRSDADNLGHELAHHLLGDTTGLVSMISIPSDHRELRLLHPAFWFGFRRRTADRKRSTLCRLVSFSARLASA